MFSDLELNKNQPTLLTDKSAELKPDIVLVNTTERKVVLFELTVPFEEGVLKAHTGKETKYAQLVFDVKKRNYQCDLICFEMGCRGTLTKLNQDRLKTLEPIQLIVQLVAVPVFVQE